MSQVPVEWLLQKADGMFPEGQGGPRAFAKAGVEAPGLFGVVAASAEPRLAEFNSQSLENTVWAFATAGFSAPTLFQQAALDIRLPKHQLQVAGVGLWARSPS